MKRFALRGVVLLGCLALLSILLPLTSAQAQEWSVSRKGNIVEIAYGSDGDFPQYGALHTDSGYLRLIPSRDAGWGTSAILLPSLWLSTGAYYQGAAISCSWSTQGSDLVISLSGGIAGLSVSGRVTLSPPARNAITAKVSMNCSGNVHLARRDCEAFKPVMLSSMHVSDRIWVASEAFVGDQPFSIPKSGFIINPCSASGTRWGLTGGDSDWKKNAPTLEVTMDREMPVSGWVTLSSDPNDDNIGMWCASETVLPNWSYTLQARR